ncbi:MAG: RluA family pseudouridine synthase, partial [Verrucomicrobiota bacterium]
MNPATPLPPVKLSSPATHEFWELPVLHEDARLLALAKPPRLLTSPDRYDPERPNLMRLLHEAVAAGQPWAAARGLSYLANVHRLDFETSGVLLLAKDKPALVQLAAQFGAGKPHKTYLALVRGNPGEDQFQVDLRLKPDPRLPGRMRWGLDGKKSLTEFTVLERFRGASLVACRPHTGRTHQIRVHLRAADHPIFGDDFYGDGVRLFLSKFKRDFRLKP